MPNDTAGMHSYKRVTDTLYRCRCGSEFTTDADAYEHILNANAERAVKRLPWNREEEDA